MKFDMSLAGRVRQRNLEKEKINFLLSLLRKSSCLRRGLFPVKFRATSTTFDDFLSYRRFDHPKSFEFTASSRNHLHLRLKGGMLILMCHDDDAPRENYFSD